MAKASKRCWSILYYLQVIISGILFLVSFAICTVGIVAGASNFFALHPAVAYVLWIVLLLILAMKEGIQISIVKAAGEDFTTVRDTHPRAYRLLKFLTKNGDKNLIRFLMGRQLIVVAIVFFLSRLTDFGKMEYIPFTEETVPIPAEVREALLKTGIFGIIVTVVIGQLTPQILAEKFSIQSLNLIIAPAVTYSSIAVERLGLTHICYAIARLFGVRSHEERMTKALAENTVKEASDAQIPAELVRCLLKELDMKIQPNMTLSHRFPSVVGGKSWPSVADFAELYEKEKLPVPEFLLPPTHKRHVPPHIVLLYYLVSRQQTAKVKRETEGNITVDV